LRRLFEYITFIVMVRNGDGHLKNFGLLYAHPGDGQVSDRKHWSIARFVEMLANF
jgi:hypothetical protein